MFDGDELKKVFSFLAGQYKETVHCQQETVSDHGSRADCEPETVTVVCVCVGVNVYTIKSLRCLKDVSWMLDYLKKTPSPIHLVLLRACAFSLQIRCQRPCFDHDHSVSSDEMNCNKFAIYIFDSIPYTVLYPNCCIAWLQPLSPIYSFFRWMASTWHTALV